MKLEYSEIVKQISRERVKGFLRADGNRTLNGDGEEILLIGMGLGNWMLPEGYMWKIYSDRYNRPRTIETMIRELAGSAYAEKFWKRFRDTYVTEEDVRRMAEAGFNSVRLPINWRILMEDEPGICWVEDGFALIDRFLDWCEKYKIYVILDLHGAPGGQTGHNIDDSIDNIPRLLIDEDSREKCLALWRELARRYRERWIVGAYDLLNEPVRTEREGLPGMEGYPEKLVGFYDECIRAVREIDPVHMLQIEGYHWSSDPSMFTRRFDDNMAIHFHRYWCNPRLEAYRGFLGVQDALGQPLFLGETGENSAEWYASMYPLALSLGIGYNIWPWKKMDCQNSPYSIRKPEGWDKVVGYTRFGPRPTYEEAWKIFDEYLENIKVENCEYIPDVIPSILRAPGSRLPAHHYDELPGEGQSFGGVECVVRPGADPEKQKDRRTGWTVGMLRMPAGGFADYTFYFPTETSRFVLTFLCPKGAGLTLRTSLGKCREKVFAPGESEQSFSILSGCGEGTVTLRVECSQGEADLLSVRCEEE